MDDLEKLFEKRLKWLDEEYIVRFNNSAMIPRLNNVINGLNKHFYSLSVIRDFDEIDDLEYRLSYITNRDSLIGYSLKLFLSDKSNRDKLSFLFAKFLAQEFRYLDLINTFNTFQHKTRTIMEQYDFTTINIWEIKDFLNNNTSIITKNSRGVVPVLQINKLEFYKNFFEDMEKPIVDGTTNYVYLMYDLSSSKIKIGFSKNPYNRERTLQSKEPQTHLLAAWKAPKSIESQLHKQFDDFRERGEWFALTFRELKQIKERMEEFK